jgi:hypothetical protein
MARRTSGSMPAPPAFQMRQDGGAHARVREFADVLGGAFVRRLLARLRENAPIWFTM